MKSFRHVVRNQTKVIVVSTIINLWNLPTWNVVVDTVNYCKVESLRQSNKQVMIVTVDNARNVQIEVADK